MKNNSPFKKREPWESVVCLENNAKREKGRIIDSEELRGRIDTEKKDKRMGKKAPMMRHLLVSFIDCRHLTPVLAKNSLGLSGH